MYQWNWEPGVLLLLLTLGLGYVSATGPLRGAFPGALPVSRAQQIAFGGGWFALATALISPIEPLSDAYLLSMHMVEHLLITLVAPPLLLIATPPWLLHPFVLLTHFQRMLQRLTHPLWATLLFHSIFSIWHIPAFYELALQNEFVHVFEHAVFVVPALLIWWPVLSPLPALPALPLPAQCLYLLIQSIPPAILGALITFNDTVLYPTYARAPRVWNLSPLMDQQLAGLIMWIPGGLVFLLVLTIRFFQWFGDDAGLLPEAVQAAATPPASPTSHVTHHES